MGAPITRRTLLWTPKTKDRPRLGRGRRVFTPEATMLAEQALAEQWDDDPLDGPLAVELEFTNTSVFIQIAQAEGPVNRKLRGDLDNYMKLVLDGLNKRAWGDDRQIVRLTGVKL